MAIKSEAYNIHFASRPEEGKSAHQLDDSFDITYGDRFREFSFWLADPKEHTRERFGLNREVLVIYSEYDTIDARILRTVDEIQIDHRFRHRLDPVLVLLIHRSDPLVTKELLSSDPDRVVVPFLEEELTDGSKGSLFVRLRIAEYFGQIDLFGMSSPITTDKYFFGRDTLVQELVGRTTSRAENSGVFGLRKTGKTSVLRAVERRVSNRPVLAEYIDCHSPRIHAARWWQVLENIVDRLNTRLKRDRRRTARVQLDYSEATAGIRFSSDIQTLMVDGDLERILVMLDEVEFITPKISGQLGQHWDDDFIPFWQTIRSTHQETQGSLVFIVAGVNPLCVQEPRFAEQPNPIFQLAPPYFLEPFQRDDVRAMVRFIGRYSGLRFEEKVYDYLCDKYGGHPFLVRTASSEVWRSMAIDDPNQRVEVSTRDFEKREVEIRTRLAQPIRDILLSLVWWYPEEYDLLQILAAGDADFVDDYVKVHPNSLVQFAQYGILKSGGTTDFAIEDIRAFIETNGDKYKSEISPFLRGDMPPDLLPEVPDLETLGRLFERRCKVEAKLRRVILMYLGFNENWDPKKIAEAIIKGLRRRPDRSEPGALFVGRTPQEAINQLYLLDLKQITLENWRVLGPLYDGQKVRFEMNMETINNARRIEAHTKPFTLGEIEDFNNSYGWVLRKLERVPNA